MCDNPELDLFCNPFPRNEFIEDEWVITGYDLTFHNLLAVDFINGNFTNEGLEEGLLIVGRLETDWFPKPILVQKKPMGWTPLLKYNDNFKNNPPTFNTLFQMSDIPMFAAYCNIYSYSSGKYSRIPDGNPLASFENFRQHDIDHNGFEDLILDISLRYWQNPLITNEHLDCEKVYSSLPVENYEVIFTFDGYEFTPYKNVEWLQHIYDGDK